MTSLRKCFLTGAAVVALIAGAGLALAQSSALHHMTVALPDGGMAQIAYSGDVPPKVSFEADPFQAAAYGPASFTTLDEISAAMDQEMNAMMKETGFWSTPMPMPQRMLRADLRDAPAGSFCMESISVTRTAADAAPKVISHRYGDCAPVGQAAFGIAPAQRRNNAHSLEIHAPRAPKPLTRPPLIEAAYQPR